jgi:hypothetical protein
MAPISPRFMLVLQRNNLRKEFKRHLARIIATQQSSGGVPNRPSLLEDLLTRPAIPPCHPGWQRKLDCDKYIFDITEVSSEHVHKINGIILSEAKESRTFECSLSAITSLDSWLKDPDLLTSQDHPHFLTENMLRLNKINLLNFLKLKFCTVDSKEECTSDSEQEIAESNWWNEQQNISGGKTVPRYL